MSKEYDVVSVGSALMDHFIRSNQVTTVVDAGVESGQSLRLPLGAKLEIEMLTHEVGGGGANTSVAFSRLGLRTGVVARLGADEAAHFVRKRLEGEGVHVGHLVHDKSNPTGESYLLRAADGNRTAMAYRGAGALFGVSDIPESLIAKTSLAIHV